LSKPAIHSRYRLALGFLFLLFYGLATAQPQLPPTPPSATSDSVAPASEPAPSYDLGALSRYEGRAVEQIDFRGIEGANPDMLRSLIPVRIGEPLRREELQQSLRTLYATGRFAGLDVEAAPWGSGVQLTYVARENYFNGPIRIEGLADNHPPKANELKNSSRLDLGEPFTEEAVLSGIQSMKKVMADNGYYESSVTYSLMPHDDTRQMEITFQVTPGVLAHVGAVTIHGDSGIPPDRTYKVTKLKPGKKVTSDHLSRALENLRKYYQKNRHLEAQVQLIGRKYHDDSNLLDYEFSVEQGAKVLITTEGEKISQRQLKRLVPIYQENTVDEDLLNEGRRNLRNYMQTRGYFDAAVEVSRHQDTSLDLVRVVYDINPGEKHKLAAIEIEGNRYFSTELIRERMSITPSSWVVENGRFSQRMLTDDVANIRNLYLNNGFLAIKVSGSLIQDYNGDKQQLAVKINIEEGPQTRVGVLQLKGNDSFGAETLQSLLTNSPGQPYSEANLLSDRDAITLFYYNRGYPDVQFEAIPTPDPQDPLRENLMYTITEGQKVSVDRVVISGLQYTRPYIIERQVRIHDGDPLNQLAMLNTQRRLYNLGIFNEVNMAVQNPDGQEPAKNVLFDLDEAKRWTFRYGGGIEFATGNLPSSSNPQGKTGVSPNGVIEVTRLNVFGKDQTLTLRGRGGLLTRRALVSYDAPRLLRKENWRLTLSGFYDNTADVNTFASNRLEGAVQVEQRYNRFTTILYRMSWQRVQVDPNSLLIDPNLIPLYTQPVRISMPSVSYIRDKRDNPINSKRGSYTAGDFGVATSAMGGQSNFARMLLDNSTYYPLHNRWVLARRTQIGLEYPYGTNFYGTGSPQTAIPLPELFFAGGSNSLRGFSINQAGPRDPDSGYAIGGQALFVNNLELRTPPLQLPLVGENVGFVFFHDMGNVFASANQLLGGIVRFQQLSLNQCAAPASTVACNFSYNPQAVGTGIRYNTPIGPVRFDLSYNFNPTRYPIREQNRVTTLRHINFFFSIGQTF
jgi:outer membrane protein assembly complex protein YaeT